MGGSYLLRRILKSVVVLFGAITLVFVFVRLAPGDPVLIMAGPEASPDEIAKTRQALGLDEPIYVQYLIFLGRVVQGDLGTSLRHHRSAVELVVEHFPPTIQLTATSMFIAVLIGVPAGVISAIKRGSWLDTLTMALSLFGQSVPTFWLGIVLITVFSVRLRLLPTSGYGSWQNLVLPTITLGFFMMALVARLTRSEMIDVLNADYLRVAYAKGLQGRYVLVRHALRNTLIPVVTIIGLQVGTLLGGAVITETIFAWPGIGSLAVDAISTLDYPVIQAVVVLSAFVFVTINLLLDVIYVRIDPRIRYG